MGLLSRCGCLAIMLLPGFFPLPAQELNAVVKVNSDMIRGANRQLFSTLEESLRTFINGRKWTDIPSGPNEKVNCSFTLVIHEEPSSGSFKGELYVQSYRPVGNAVTVTPMLNLLDKEMEFDYKESQPLQFDPSFVQENLTATVAFYSYLILGLDLDSRSQLGGASCFRNMALIASNVQSYGWRGWGRRNMRNRPAISDALNDGALEEYRRMWFDYHRNGLDAPTGKGERRAEIIISAIEVLSDLHSKRPANVLPRLFGDAKLGEVVALLSKAGAPEKRQAYEALLNLYPARSVELGPLR